MNLDRSGNCYYASEALYHILGGKRAGWKPMRVYLGDPKNKDTHWFLKHKSGLIIDPSIRQFNYFDWFEKPDYKKAKGCGFLTKRPSKAARKLINRLTWYHED